MKPEPDSEQNKEPILVYAWISDWWWNCPECSWLNEREGDPLDVWKDICEGCKLKVEIN